MCLCACMQSKAWKFAQVVISGECVEVNNINEETSYMKYQLLNKKRLTRGKLERAKDYRRISMLGLLPIYIREIKQTQAYEMIFLTCKTK